MSGDHLKIAITGGSGFVGRDLTASLAAKGHELVLLSRRPSAEMAGAGLPNVKTISGDMHDLNSLNEAFCNCDAVAHCAGINNELGTQTYERVHVQGSENVVKACQEQGVSKLVFTSFLKARPNSGSKYHESKWRAEEIIRNSELDFVILKPGVIFAKGDHMVSHMALALKLSPVFALVGGDVSLRPIALRDFTGVLEAALIDPRLSKGTFAVLGGEEVKLSEAAKRLASVLHRPVLSIVLPLPFLYFIARAMKSVMKEPLLTESQITMIAEGLADALPGENELPVDLRPANGFTLNLIEQAL